MAKENEHSEVVWFLAGAAIGATVALLFAPYSGREARKRIGRKASEGREYISDAGRDIADKSKDLYEKGRRLADEAADLFERGRKMAQG